jgi:mannose-6-phosphate isomerase-like protein (cupin superfamily)
MDGAKLIRKGESVTTRTVDGEVVELLFSSGVMEGIVVELEPLSGFQGTYRHSGEEMHVVLEGEVEFEVGGETFRCRQGDVLWHQSSLEHTIRNPEAAPAAYLTVHVPPAVT